MQARTTSRGYTIIEVMIFLAVTGFMFVIAATFVAGKQSAAEFTQGMNDINTKMQETINDVSNGYFDFPSNYTCTTVGSVTPMFSSGSGTQGGNFGCIFLGKVVEFDASASGGGSSDPAQYNIYTIVGRQFSGDTGSSLVGAFSPANSFDDAQPVASDGSSGSPNLTQSNQLEDGLNETSMYEQYADGTDHPISAIGFFGSFPNYSNGSIDAPESGSQSVTVVTIPPIDSGTVTSWIQFNPDQLDAQLADPNIGPNPKVVICFDGQPGRYGSLTIGGDTTSGQRLSTSIQINDGSKPAGC